ncbi:MAG: hypothetical protein KAU31_17000 [Spirochaetaceae bacterium]|nr:hypothetical protein [Spirochaetaceae bacterium]
MEQLLTEYTLTGIAAGAAVLGVLMAVFAMTRQIVRDKRIITLDLFGNDTAIRLTMSNITRRSYRVYGPTFLCGGKPVGIEKQAMQTEKRSPFIAEPGETIDVVVPLQKVVDAIAAIPDQTKNPKVSASVKLFIGRSRNVGRTFKSNAIRLSSDRER